MSQDMLRQNASATDVGARLKQTREDKDISISAASMQTNLRADIIEKLEANDFASIGAPVFTRGYLNIYARFLGLDEEEVAKGFAALNHERKEDTLRLNTANIESQNKPYRRSAARGWFSLILVLLIGGGIISQLLDNQSWLMQQIRGTFTQQSNADVSENTNNDQTPEESPGFTIEVAGEDVQNNTELPTLTSMETQEVIRAESGDRQSDPLEAPEIGLSSLDSTEEPSTEISVGENIAEQAEVKSEAILKTNQENWMQITDASGKVLDSRIFKAGEEIQLAGEAAPYRLNIGRPNAITLTVNGESKSLDSYRRKGQIRLFELSIPNE